MNPYLVPGIGLTSEKIIELWTNHYGLALQDILTKDRHSRLAIPRQILMYCLRTFSNLTLHEIGEIVQKDHATVIHSCRQVKSCYLNDRVLSIELNELLDEIKDLSGKITIDTLTVKITRDDLFRLLPDLTEEEKREPMAKLWSQYKNR